MRNDDIDVGVVVQLKSGGPRMTVRQVWVTPPRVEVSWFKDDGTLATWAFPTDCVRRSPA